MQSTERKKNNDQVETVKKTLKINEKDLEEVHSSFKQENDDDMDDKGSISYIGSHPHSNRKHKKDVESSGYFKGVLANPSYDSSMQQNIYELYNTLIDNKVQLRSDIIQDLKGDVCRENDRLHSEGEFEFKRFSESNRSQEKVHNEPEPHREKHNKMMRENRNKFNKKFSTLRTLLEFLHEPDDTERPMKNKIQTLEKAIVKYAKMEEKKAMYENELMFSKGDDTAFGESFSRIFSEVPNIQGRCTILLQYLCHGMKWKYGEVWICGADNIEIQDAQLSDSIIAKHNMPESRLLLSKFSKRPFPRHFTSYFRRNLRNNHPIWIPDISIEENQFGCNEAKIAKVTTCVFIPIYISKGIVKYLDALIAVMHLDDEICSFPNRIRPYKTKEAVKIEEMTKALKTSLSG